jgi:hypothetical protein
MKLPVASQRGIYKEEAIISARRAEMGNRLGTNTAGEVG